MASGNYTGKLHSQEPEPTIIPSRASVTRQLPAIKQQEERRNRTLPPARMYPAHYAIEEAPVARFQHVIDEFRESPLAHLPRHLPWLRPFVICLIGIVVLFFVLISAGIFQRPAGPSNLVYSSNAQSFPIQVGGSLSAVNTWQNSTGPISSLTPIPTHTGPYSVISKPTITVDFMNQVPRLLQLTRRGQGTGTLRSRRQVWH